LKEGNTMDDHLMEQLAAPENLLAAWRSVRGNIPRYRRDRASGPDGVSLTEFERDLTAQLNILHDMLMSNRYLPIPPAHFRLRKKSGGERVISVLSVRDRVAQRAAQQTLEPLWEVEFLDCSFGFRPGLSIDQAITCAQRLRAGGNPWAVDGDISACFDSLDHDLLVERVKRKVHDGRVMRLLQNWLDAGVMQAGAPQPNEHPLAGQIEKATHSAQRGMDWVLGTLVQERDPYRAAHYEASREAEPGEAARLATRPDALASGIRRQALQQIAANGLMWGASLVQPAIQGMSKTALTTFSSPTGRRLLQKGALASSGFAGVAILAALGAYLLNRQAGPASTGVLQGSPLSPLLANIYLHPFDVMLQHRGHRLVRFADDWVILCPDQPAAESAYNDAVHSLARLRLKVNREKTCLRGPGETFEWLGMPIR